MPLIPFCTALFFALLATPGGDDQAPVARIVFPLGSALTDAASVRVRGVASDPSGVAEVHVNGMPATSADGFATWSVQVPLALGDNVLLVETADIHGNTDLAAAATLVRRDGALMRRPEGLALDTASELAYVFDWVPDGAQIPTRTRILSANLATGETSLVSSRSRGTGPLPRYATGEMEYDALGERLLLLDSSAYRLLAVDPVSGDRTLISGDGVGSGPAFQNSLGLELDAQNSRAWVVNRSFGPSSGAVLEVDLDSGDRTILSGPGVGTGPWPEYQSWMTRSEDGNRLLIACYLSDLVLGVNLSNGNRSIVSDASAGIGVPWFNVWDVATLSDGRSFASSPSDGRLFGLDPALGTYAEIAPPAPDDPRELYDLELDLAKGRLLATDDLRAAILSMDLNGGELEPLLRNSIGSGAPFRRSMVAGTAVDARGLAWVLDNEHGELISVHPTSGKRTLVSGGGQGSGPELEEPVRIAIDDASVPARAIVFDTELKAVVAIDLSSGARTIVSGPGVGSGPALNVPQGSTVSLDVGAGAAWVLDSLGLFLSENRLMRVDLTTGARTLVSGDGVGTGPTLIDASGLAIDQAGDRALTFTFNQLVAIDLASGDRSVLSSNAVGNGPSYGTPVLLDWDAAAGRAIVYGRPAGITAVDGATGDREHLAESDEDKGSGLAWPLSMALWRPHSGAEPLLFLGDHELTALTVLDLARDPLLGSVPAARIIITR